MGERSLTTKRAGSPAESTAREDLRPLVASGSVADARQAAPDRFPQTYPTPYRQ
ncbi:hypothetical protein Pme01_20520 [Planosporangium mesophilum]|uniref:Uncharacterized protein n=1 Tax=Planosporangium mesophilum TaxID=689768 RepID=A0A8J3TJB8_9ACTN|nr:hypothetical protein Pme01_20520 [Planosporangium mesophilum]